MKRIKWVDNARNEKVLTAVKEYEHILKTALKQKKQKSKREQKGMRKRNINNVLEDTEWDRSEHVKSSKGRLKVIQNVKGGGGGYKRTKKRILNKSS